MLPTHNERNAIGRVIDEIRRWVRDSEIIVIDDGSDGTAEIARSKGAVVIKRNGKFGKGSALVEGAKQSKGDVLVFMDGDGSYPPQAIPLLVRSVLNGKDIVFSSRFLEKVRGMSPIRYIGNKMFIFLASLLHGKTTDLCTGMYAIRKEGFLELNPRAKGFEIEAEIFVKACRNSLERVEVPILYRARNGSKLNPIVDGLKIFKTLVGAK